MGDTGVPVGGNEDAVMLVERDLTVLLECLGAQHPLARSIYAFALEQIALPASARLRLRVFEDEHGNLHCKAHSQVLRRIGVFA